ncbi:NAD(P)/FAD-dependent oxidoreductase, partial [Chloroflexota bacterium]
PAAKAKDVTVIGGGLAGMEAARVASLRGHKVTLYEEKDRLGGQWILAATPPHKGEFMEFIDYQSRQLKNLGVKVELGKAITAAVINEKKPHVVIIATGAVPEISSIPGVQLKNVLTAWDVLAGKDGEKGKKVLVVGGNRVGLETAEFMAAKGKKVVVVEETEHLGANIGRTVRWHLLNRLRDDGLEMFRSTKVKEIRENEVIVTTKEGEEQIWAGIDTVVLAVCARSRNELAEEIKGLVEEIYIIGDAAEPRDGVEATREGAEIGRRI